MCNALHIPSILKDLPKTRRGELDLGVVELLGALPLAEFCGNGGCLDDLDAVVAHPVTRSHLSVHLFNSDMQWSPRASCVRSWDAHQSPTGDLFRQPGTDGICRSPFSQRRSRLPEILSPSFSLCS
nr:Os01g0666950 [Ipomoea batatas]